KGLLNELGAEVNLLIPESRGEVVETTTNSLKRDTDRLIAVGGDGLIHQTVNALVGTDTTLGIIPVGTGNDFARSLGLDSGGLFEQAQNALSPAVEVDLIKCGSTFVATSTICGFPATVNLRANNLRFPKGSSSYTFATLMELPVMSPTFYKLKLDNESLEVKAAAVIVANSAYFGGGMKICPDADTSDGLLDVCIIGDVGKFDLLRSFLKVRTGDHVDHPKVSIYEASEIEITGTGIIRGDGEPLGELPMKIFIQRGAINVAGGDNRPPGRG
ncbi:MAG: sphingosine kinase, partial [Acidimicrobiaceae bacterium]|nr:sphingosine kinase [Acidimicrobiaceae bacterium]